MSYVFVADDDSPVTDLIEFRLKRRGFNRTAGPLVAKRRGDATPDLKK